MWAATSASKRRQDTLTSRSSPDGVQLGLSIGLGSVSSTTGPGSYAPNTNFLSDTGNMFSNAGSFLANGGPFGNAAPGQLSNVNNGSAPLKNSGSIALTYGRGSEDKAWTNNLTTIDGTSGTTLNVAGNTNVKGAVIESSGGGPLAVNTGTFTYQNLQDYDRTQNINASFNVTIPLGSFGWQQNAPASGGAPTATPPAAPPPSPSMLAQLGQTLGQYPIKFQLAYKATDKEATTFATVGQGNINVSDTAKQAALEKSGATGALDKLNRDVTKTQVITKNTTEAFNVFVSTQSIQTVAAIIGKATDYIEKLLADGKVLNAKDVDLDALQKRGVNLNDLSVCVPASSSGGDQSGFLFNLFITPAYAGDNPVPCIVRFNGAKGLTNSDGVVMSDADRLQMAADLANSQWQKALADYATMASAQQSGDNDQYQKAAADLKLQLSYFAMCATDAQWNNNVATYFSNPAWAPYLTVAQDYARGANELAQKYGNYADLNTPALVQLKKSDQALYSVLIEANYQLANPQIMDIAFPLAALGQDQNPSPGQHTDTLAFVANEISSLTIKYQNITVEGLPQGVGQDNPGTAWNTVLQANALLSAVSGLNAPDKGYLSGVITDKYNTYIQTQLAQAQSALQQPITETSAPQSQAASYTGAAYSAALAMSLLTGDKSYIDLVLNKSQGLPDNTVAPYRQLANDAIASIDNNGGKSLGFSDTLYFVTIKGGGLALDQQQEALQVDRNNNSQAVAFGKATFENQQALNTTLTIASLGANVAKQTLADGLEKAGEVLSDPPPPPSKPALAPSAAELEGTTPPLRETGDLPPLGCCFIAGTLVETNEGLKRIEDIHVGDLVQARNAKTGATSLKPVMKLFQRHNRQIFDVKLATSDGRSEVIGACGRASVPCTQFGLGGSQQACPRRDRGSTRRRRRARRFRRARKDPARHVQFRGGRSPYLFCWPKPCLGA